MIILKTFFFGGGVLFVYSDLKDRTTEKTKEEENEGNVGKNTK